MKKLSLTILTLLLSFSAYAESSPETTVNSMSTEIENQSEILDRMSQITIECEYDSMCIYNKVEELSKTGDPAYVALFKDLQKNKALIDFEHQNCNTDEIRSVKKSLANCDKEIISFAGSAQGELDQQQLEEKLATCHASSIGILASEGNIFAQDIMSKLTENNSEESEKWKKMVESHKDKPEYEVYKKCSLLDE